MKRVLTVGLASLVGTAAVAAVSPVRELPAAWAGWDDTAARSAELDRVQQLGQAQREATDDVVARLADGRLSLADATTLLDDNTQGRAVFRDQLATVRSEGTDRERLAGFVTDRAKEHLGGDAGQVSALVARLHAEGK